jgi:DNA invertase Pin-like site-specific DNA recombinase
MKKEVPARVFAYLRISSDRQDARSQKEEVERYAEKNALEVTDWIEVEMSATKNGFKKRRIDELLHTVRPGDTLIVPEISRLARSVKETHEICSALLKRKVQAHFVKQALQLKDDLPSKIIVNAFGLAAEIEADLISQRTKAGLAAAKARGKKLGNPRLFEFNRNQGKGADEFALSLEKTLRAYKVQGMTERAMCAALNEAGVPARRGGQWSQTQVHILLKRLARAKRAND